MSSPATADLPAGTWELDSATTAVTVTAKKLFGLITVPATLNVSSGRIRIGADHQLTAVEVVADASSYDSGNAKRDTHVRDADFLDAEAHPELSFAASELTPAGGGFRAGGSVTVKGRTFPLDVEATDVEVADGRASFSATAEIDRKAIGVDKLPSFIIGRTLHLAVSASCVLVED